MNNNTQETAKRIQAVKRAFRIEGLVREQGSVRISDVVEEFNMPTSTAHVYLKTLVDTGYLVKDTEGYRLGLRFLRDGAVARHNLAIYSAAKQEIEALAEDTGEVANLGVEEEGQRVILYQSEGDKAVYDNALVGEFTNMHWTALGKALLAELPNEKIEEILEQHGLPGATSNTIVSSEALNQELEQIREDEYALEDQERRDGIRSIAVSVTVRGETVGAISLSGPKERFDKGRIENELLPTLRDRANVVEIKFAYE